MLENLKRILKVYPLPVFVLLLTFAMYYTALELLRKKESNQIPISQEESMQSITNTEPPKQKDLQELASMEEPLITPQQLPEPKPISYLTSSVKSLNIRQSPNTQSPVIGKLTPDKFVLSVKEEGEWILLADSSTQEVLGWALNTFLKAVESPQQDQSQSFTTPKSPKTLYSSKVPNLNIRETPSTESKILNKLTPDDIVNIVEINGAWAKIKDYNSSGKNGWVIRRSLVSRN